MVDMWLQIGGGAILLVVLGTLLKCVGDIGEIKGTVSGLATRMDKVDADVRDLRTEMNARFLRIETEMNARFLRIENLLLGRPPESGAPPATPESGG